MAQPACPFPDTVTEQFPEVSAEEVQAIVEQFKEAGILLPVTSKILDIDKAVVKSACRKSNDPKKQEYLSPVLLVGGGRGYAAAGLAFIASYLRRNGIESYVKPYNEWKTFGEMRSEIKNVIERVKPRIIGISFKWFSHIYRSLHLAALIKDLEPDIRIVMGGDSASHYWKELIAYDCIDTVVIGDGELPFLRICQLDPLPPNCVFREGESIIKTPVTYIQNEKNSSSTYLSHINDIYLSREQQAYHIGLLLTGKGCSRFCLYCGGTRDMQKTNFGREVPFLRSSSRVKNDIETLKETVGGLVIDFDDPTLEFSETYWREAFSSLDLSQCSLRWFCWAIPSPETIEFLARRFREVLLCVDMGALSERQRNLLYRRDELKKCPADRELLSLCELCDGYDNVHVQVDAIAGLPFIEMGDLKKERELVERLLKTKSFYSLGYFLIRAQTGAKLTEYPEKYGMKCEVRTFGDFLEWYGSLGADGYRDDPMILHEDERLNSEIRLNMEEIQKISSERTREKDGLLPVSTSTVEIRSRFFWKNPWLKRNTYPLGEWYGLEKEDKREGEKNVTLLTVESFGVRIGWIEYFYNRVKINPEPDESLDFLTGKILEAILALFEQKKSTVTAFEKISEDFDISRPEFYTTINILSERRFLLTERDVP